MMMSLLSRLELKQSWGGWEITENSCTPLSISSSQRICNNLSLLPENKAYCLIAILRWAPSPVHVKLMFICSPKKPLFCPNLHVTAYTTQHSMQQGFWNAYLQSWRPSCAAFPSRRRLVPADHRPKPGLGSGRQGPPAAVLWPVGLQTFVYLCAWVEAGSTLFPNQQLPPLCSLATRQVKGGVDTGCWFGVSDSGLRWWLTLVWFIVLHCVFSVCG